MAEIVQHECLHIGGKRVNQSTISTKEVNQFVRPPIRVHNARVDKSRQEGRKLAIARGRSHNREPSGYDEFLVYDRYHHRIPDARDEPEGEEYFHLREVDRKIVLARREYRGAESGGAANIEEGSNRTDDFVQQLPRNALRGRW